MRWRRPRTHGLFADRESRAAKSRHTLRCISKISRSNAWIVGVVDVENRSQVPVQAETQHFATDRFVAIASVSSRLSVADKAMAEGNRLPTA
jgi:hypothetical protein